MKRLKAPIGDQSGQAVVEYILLLVIVLAITLGGLYQFNTAFQKFAESYFGSYLACLLETGEIPAMGADTGGSKVGGTCNDSFKAFSLADGRPANGSGSGSSSSSASGKSGTSGSGSSGGSGGNGGSADGSGSGRLGSSFGRANGRPVTAVEKTGAGKEEGAPGDAGAMNSGRGRVNMPLSGKDKKTEVQLTGPGGSDADKEDERHDTKKVAETAENRLRKKKELVVLARKPAAADADDKDEGLTFSYLLRWLLIGAMILALVVFLGQQALSISKSQD